MQQIKNGFADYYYLNKQGKVFNASSNKYLKPTKNIFKLQNTDGKTTSISLKRLYYLVYNEIYVIDNIEDLQDEQWKYIEDTNKMYLVSNKGRIKSYCEYNARILKPTITPKGYLRLQIMKDGIKLNKFIHTLVMIAFKGKAAKEDMIIHHKDFNKQNNCIDNLEYLSMKEHNEIHHKKEKEIQDNGGIQ